MALALRFTATDTQGDGVVRLIEIYQEGYVGSSTLLTLGANPFDELTGGADETLTTPRRQTERRYRVLASGANLTALQTISGSGSKDWLVVDKKDGTEDYRGYILTESIGTGLLTDLTTFQFVVRDLVQSLDEIDFVDGSGDFWDETREALSVWFARCMDKTGHDLTHREDSSWKPAAETGRPLSVEVAGNRWSEASDDGRAAHKTGTVLDTILRSKGLVMAQWAGSWVTIWPMGRLGVSTVTRRLYSAAGAYSSEDAVYPSFVTLTLDSDGNDWVDNTDEDTGMFAAKSVKASYLFGPFQAGSIENGSFDSWVDEFEPYAWTRSGGTFGTDYRVRSMYDSNHNPGGSLREVTVALGSDLDTQKAACTHFYVQEAGGFASGVTLNLSMRFAALGIDIPTGGIQNLQNKIDAAEMFYIIEYSVGGVDYNYVKGTGWSLSSGLSTADKRIRVDGVPGDPTYTTTRLSVGAIKEELALDATPGAQVGTMTLKLGCPVRVQVATIDIQPDNEVWGIWDDVILDVDEDISGSGIAYEVEDATNTEGESIEFDLLIGEGPTDEAPGAIYLSDGTTQATNYRRDGTGTQMPHTQLVAMEAMRFDRQDRRRIAFKLINQTISPVEAFDYDGARWWPVYVRTTYTSPGLNPQTEVVAEELSDGTETGLVTDTERPGRTGILGGGDPNVAILTALGGRVDLLNTISAVTVTTAEIAAGAQTTCSITPIATSFLDDDEVFTILDPVTHATYDLTANGAYVPTSSSLPFDSYVFPNLVKTGAHVFKGVEALLVKLIITNAGLSVIVSARELGFVNETIGAGVDRGPIGGALVIDGLNYNVFDDQEIRIVDNGPGGTGDEYTAFIAGGQSATDTTFDIDDGAGGEVTFTRGMQVGGTIQYFRQEDLAPTALNIFFQTIELNAKQITMNADSHFKSTNWNGTLSGVNVITAPGSLGFCLTGDGDFDATGTLTAAGGVFRIDNTDGLQVVGTTSKTDGRAIQFVDALGPSPTREYLGLWVNTDIDEAFVESDTTLNLKSNTAGGAILSLGASGAATFTSTAALFLPKGTTGERPGSAFGGEIRYNSTTSKFEAYENGAWTDMIGGGAVAITDGYMAVGDGSTIEDSSLPLFEDATGFAVGHTSPAVLFHVKGIPVHAYIEANATGETAISQSTSGLDLLAAGINTSSKYMPGLWWATTDPNKTTQNPYRGAGIVAYAAEGFGADTDTGMGLEFYTSPTNNGATSVPVLAMTINDDGIVTIADQLNVPTQILLTELASDPAAVSQGTFVFTKTDNRLYFQNGSPETVHKILSDQDLGVTVGDFSGPGSSTNNAIVRFDGTTGKVGQNTGVTIADTTNDMSTPGDITLTAGDLILDSDGASAGRLRLGETQGDADIYWDGGALVINSTNNIEFMHGTDTMAKFEDDGACTLYYDNVASLTTNPTGGSLTGIWSTTSNFTSNGTLTATDACHFQDQVNISTQLYLTELVSDPAASAQGTFVYTKTDNRLYFQNGSPGTVHKILSDQDTVGDVDGPGSSTSNAMVRFNGTTGKIIQDSGNTIDNSNNINVVGESITLDGSGGAGGGVYFRDGAAEVMNIRVIEDLGSVTFSGVQMTGSYIFEFNGGGGVGIDDDLDVYSTLFALSASHVAIDTPTSEPTNNTTNFPWIGATVFWRSGSELWVTCRSGTSTYINNKVVTMT